MQSLSGNSVKDCAELTFAPEWADVNGFKIKGSGTLIAV
jgi:hypothetical protein